MRFSRRLARFSNDLDIRFSKILEKPSAPLTNARLRNSLIHFEFMVPRGGIERAS